MIKISLKSLIELMVHEGHQFVIEGSDVFEDRRVYRFVVANNYPATQIHVGIGNDPHDEVKKDRNRVVQGRVLLHYDATNDGVISCSLDVHKVILDLKKRSLNKMVDEHIARTASNNAGTTTAIVRATVPD